MTNIQEEIWKDVVGYEGLYKVSSMGRVLNVKRNRQRRPQLKKSERRFYYRIGLHKGGVQMFKYIHNLMTDAFFGPDETKVTDHINNISTDNRLSNLQKVTVRVNSTKDRKRPKSSKYTGVHWHKGNKRWRAQIIINSKRIYLGEFRSEEEARDAYNKAIPIHELEKLKK